MRRRAGGCDNPNEKQEKPMQDSDFDFDDLELGELSVTAMRDGVALPETGASYTNGSCCSCIDPQ
jgi:hypothetical protein